MIPKALYTMVHNISTMNLLYKVLLLSALVGSASAAVYYATTNPEARIFFHLDWDVEDTNPMQNLVNGEGFWTNSLNVGNVSSDEVFMTEFQHRNRGDQDYSAIIYFDIECDPILDITSSGLNDATHITFTAPDGAVTECNDPAYIDKISDQLIRITPMSEEIVFPAGERLHSIVAIDFVPNAYGDYTLTVNTTKLV